MFYRQIIEHNGIPFPVTLPVKVPARDELTDAQFNEMMAIGLEQAKADDSFTVNEVFSELEKTEG